MPSLAPRKAVKLTKERLPQRPHPLAHEKILRHLHKVRKPEYIGTIAVEIGYSLGKTESYIQFMIDAGEIERLGARDKSTLGVRDDAEMIQLMEKFSVAKAHLL